MSIINRNKINDNSSKLSFQQPDGINVSQISWIYFIRERAHGSVQKGEGPLKNLFIHFFILHRSHMRNEWTTPKFKTFGSKLLTQICIGNTGKQIHKKVLTGHWEGFGFREGESRIVEELKHVLFQLHFRMTVAQLNASSGKRIPTARCPTDWQYFVVCHL